MNRRLMFGSSTVLRCSLACRRISNLESVRYFSGDARICVIGAGPAGFYASQHILKTLPNARIDIIEKLPVPFGLVRHVIDDE